LRTVAYAHGKHAAARTDEYLFSQLVPYIGNKRKLIDLIGQAIAQTGAPAGGTFVDFFAGSGIVSRLAKKLGYRVIANDWEPYTQPINECAIGCNAAPAFARLGGYEAALARLNHLPPRIDWVTQHLCPRDDAAYDVTRDRLFYMRKNGMRIDAMRCQIEEWQREGWIDNREAACLLAPLLYQACYTSNTSGVFKGFHNGWGGQTGTALYRIASDLALRPAIFFDNGLDNRVTCLDAQALAEALARSGEAIDIAYLDPPYNQHPYASNYHVLNSITLWDKPAVSPQIDGRTKSAIRTDWRTARRSAYNYRREAAGAYRALLNTIQARHILTSYSTDGIIPLSELIEANTQRGRVSVVMRGYKRYRVSSQRFSAKPMNAEFVLLVNTRASNRTDPQALERAILESEKAALEGHAERRGAQTPRHQPFVEGQFACEESRPARPAALP